MKPPKKRERKQMRKNKIFKTEEIQEQGAAKMNREKKEQLKILNLKQNIIKH